MNTPAISALREAVSPRRLAVVTVALYACAAVAIEFGALVGGPLVGAIGYAVLLLVLTNHVALGVLHEKGRAVFDVAWFAVLAIPLVTRLAALTLEEGRIVVVRHYALVGGVVGAAAITAVVAFPELRPPVRPSDSARRQLTIALAGVPLGLALALVFSPDSIAPQHGRWQSAAVLVLLVVGAAVVEELIFRGALQTALRRPFGRAAPAVGTAAFVLVYLGVRPVSFVFVLIGLGLAAAIVVERTGAIHGVLAARILLLVGLVYAWPRLLHLE